MSHRIARPSFPSRRQFALGMKPTENVQRLAKAFFNGRRR
jgi:hypothetical protein